MQKQLYRRLNSMLNEIGGSAALRGRQLGMFPSARNVKQFVVLTSIRSGSTMLTSVLDQHPEVACFFELFHIDSSSIPFGRCGYEHLRISPEVLKLRKENPPRFLENYIWSYHPKRIKAAGFKLLYTQGRVESPAWWKEPPFDAWWSHCGVPPIYGSSENSLWNYLKSNDSISIIHLRRENLLASVVSAATAKMTGAWGDGASGGFLDSNSTKITIDPQELHLALEGSSRFHQEIRSFFEDDRVLEVTYEELTGSKARAAFHRVFDFLEVAKIPPDIRTRKMRSDGLTSAVENWDEVERILLDSVYADRIADWLVGS